MNSRVENLEKDVQEIFNIFSELGVDSNIEKLPESETKKVISQLGVKSKSVQSLFKNNP